jgi:hypothetical protein
MNLKDIASIASEALVFLLHMRRFIKYAGLRLLDIHTKSYDGRFRYSSNFKDIASAI